MKINKILKKALIILIITLLSIISFVGIYVKDKNKSSNKVKDFELGMDLKGTRRIELNVSKETEKVNYDEQGNVIDSSDTTTEVATSEDKPVNDESILTSKNYNKAKKIIENRLKTMKVSNYEVRVDDKTGKIIIDIPENESTDSVVSQLQYKGKFEVVDKDTGEVLMTNDDLKTVKADMTAYTTIYLSIQFNKEGTKKFKDITNTYIETKVSKDNEIEENIEDNTDVEEAEETTENKEETITREISLKLDGQVLLSTHFDKEISNGLLQLSVGTYSSSTTAEDLKENRATADNMAAVLNNGMMPIVYTIDSNEYIASEVEEDNINLFISLVIVIITIAMIYYIVKYEEKGIFASIALIGYIAILLIAIRYINITIVISGLVAISLSILLMYISILKILKYNFKIDDKKEAFKRAMIKNIFILVPVIILSIIFTFNKWLPVFSFGTIMFWGVLINIIYNLIFTKKLIVDSKN